MPGLPKIWQIYPDCQRFSNGRNCGDICPKPKGRRLNPREVVTSLSVFLSAFIFENRKLNAFKIKCPFGFLILKNENRKPKTEVEAFWNQKASVSEIQFPIIFVEMPQYTIFCEFWNFAEQFQKCWKFKIDGRISKFRRAFSKCKFKNLWENWFSKCGRKSLQKSKNIFKKQFSIFCFVGN